MVETLTLTHQFTAIDGYTWFYHSITTLFLGSFLLDIIFLDYKSQEKKE